MTRAGAVAIIGGSGFIGGHLATALRRENIPVSIFDRENPAVRDGRPSPGLVEAATVFYVAGGVSPMTAEKRQDVAAAELATFEEVLDVTANGAKPARVVLASSGGTLYSTDAEPPYRESDEVRPNNVYGAVKLRMEQVLLARTGVEPVAVRLSNVYGPGQRARNGLGVIAHWLDAIRRGEKPVLHGDPAATRDFLYIADAVDLLVRIHAVDRSPSILNSGSGVPTSLAEVAALVMEVAGGGQGWETTVAGRPSDRLHCHLCVDLARDSLGWQPTTTLREGLRLTWLVLSPRLRMAR